MALNTEVGTWIIICIAFMEVQLYVIKSHGQSSRDLRWSSCPKKKIIFYDKRQVPSLAKIIKYSCGGCFMRIEQQPIMLIKVYGIIVIYL